MVSLSIPSRIIPASGTSVTNTTIPIFQFHQGLSEQLGMSCCSQLQSFQFHQGLSITAVQASNPGLYYIFQFHQGLSWGAGGDQVPSHSSPIFQFHQGLSPCATSSIDAYPGTFNSIKDYLIAMTRAEALLISILSIPSRIITSEQMKEFLAQIHGFQFHQGLSSSKNGY